MPTATPAIGTGPPSEAPSAAEAPAASGSELHPRRVGLAGPICPSPCALRDAWPNYRETFR